MDYQHNGIEEMNRGVGFQEKLTVYELWKIISTVNGIGDSSSCSKESP
jgi:hypothetical protein